VIAMAAIAATRTTTNAACNAADSENFIRAPSDDTVGAVRGSMEVYVCAPVNRTAANT